MNRDVITDSVAAMAIMTCTAMFVQGDDGTVSAVTASSAAIIEGGIPEGFYAARDALSAALSQMSLDDPDAYAAFVMDVSAAGSTGWLACSPRNHLWPDAMAGFAPGDNIRTPSGRCYPLAHGALSVAMQGFQDSTVIEDWCRENHGLLACEQVSENLMRMSGWCGSQGQAVSFMLQSRDFTVPWRIMENPDGSDEVRDAETLACTDVLFNAWAPGMPAEPRQRQTGGDA